MVGIVVVALLILLYILVYNTDSAVFFVALSRVHIHITRALKLNSAARDIYYDRKPFISGTTILIPGVQFCSRPSIYGRITRLIATEIILHIRG